MHDKINIFENAFDWAKKFPQLCNEKGNFEGFDVVIGNPPYIQLKKMPELKHLKQTYETYNANGDIYTLFIEQGIQILKPNGRLSYITSNKWLRAAYGESLREYLLKNTTIEILIDFVGLKIFDEATVDTGIIEILKLKNAKQTVVAVRFDKTFNLKKDSIADYFQKHKIQLQNFTKESWNLKSEKENSIKTKIEKIGKVIENWSIHIFRGITTGLNEAFVIDNQTKERLIKEDKNNAQIIKPLLRGRDIKQYYYENSDLWIICLFPAQNINIEKYPTIKSYLSNYKTRLDSKPIEFKGEWKGRKKGNFEWYEIQDNTAYFPEFEKEKIVFTKASQTKSFAYDNKKMYLQNTSYILTGENLKYLLGILNSKLITFAFLNYYQSGCIEGEITVQAVNKLPIPEITEANQETVNQIETLVNEIIGRKETDKQADISVQTSKIDQLVYQLYELTDKEIEMIENEINE